MAYRHAGGRGAPSPAPPRAVARRAAPGREAAGGGDDRGDVLGAESLHGCPQGFQISHQLVTLCPELHHDGHLGAGSTRGAVIGMVCLPGVLQVGSTWAAVVGMVGGAGRGAPRRRRRGLEGRVAVGVQAHGRRRAPPGRCWGAPPPLLQVRRSRAAYQVGGGDGLEARLLVDAAPHDVARAAATRRRCGEQRHCHRHARRQRQHLGRRERPGSGAAAV